jgi:hypothetical protein
MKSLLEEMQQCKSVKACIELAITDAYGEDEQASAWLTCIGEMFGRFKRVNVMGHEVVLKGFDLSGGIRSWRFAKRGSTPRELHSSQSAFPISRRLKLVG